MATGASIITLAMLVVASPVAAAGSSDSAGAPRITVGSFPRPLPARPAHEVVPVGAEAETLANGPVTAPERQAQNELIGLYYFRARYYDPATGRFLQRDPVWDPGNFGNQYSFVGNGPISRVDPHGEDARVQSFLRGFWKGIVSFCYKFKRLFSFLKDPRFKIDLSWNKLLSIFKTVGISLIKPYTLWKMGTKMYYKAYMADYKFTVGLAGELGRLSGDTILKLAGAGALGTIAAALAKGKKFKNQPGYTKSGTPPRWKKDPSPPVPPRD